MIRIFHSLGFAPILCAALLFTLLAVLPAGTALAGQAIIIDNGNHSDVFGNGTLPNGDHPVGGSATGNSVTINGGRVDTVYGGHATDGGSATGNSVTINGGVVRKEIYGGYASSSLSGSATGNSVTINGGELRGYEIYGGHTRSDGSATATGNSVTISGSPIFDYNRLYGGRALKGVDDVGDAFTGNTLNLWNYSGTGRLGRVQNFQYYNFVLPASLTSLTVNGTAYLNNRNGAGSTVTGVSLVGGAAPLRPLDSVTLIEAETLDTAGFTQETAQGKHGATLLYDWTLDVENQSLVATLDSLEINPQSKALSEGFLSGLALTAQGADLVAGQGMSQAVRAAHGLNAASAAHDMPNAASAANGAGDNAPDSGAAGFAALSGSHSRYNTGSHVDMNSVSMLTGLAYGLDTAPGRLTLGAFFEYGSGNYDTHNSFSNAASVDGDGDTRYMGGGVLGRMDFAVGGADRPQQTGQIASGPTGSSPRSVIYVEASARMGRMHNNYNTSDLQDGIGQSVGGYDSSSLYYGLHIGTGYIRNLTEKASFDLYGKYFWTRQEGDSITLATGDPVKFKAADSQRLRFGGRFAYTVNEYLSPYIGAAYEHEFDGKARANTYGYSIDAPSLRGDTGIGEIGLPVKPFTGNADGTGSALPFSFELGLQGYTGKREGVTGNLQLRFEF
ncbi:MAG: autotransporter outer membrane beta-barrel domain-containing protein [Deltaproteobacteria bacterium]|jgi:hypothetical protein|nr:autotransporter outer membrane beta-barrel domain-containing protein [Deltaproteobacteria bacterium]